MNTNFLMNGNIPVLEIEYESEKFFLTPFRGISFQVSMTADEIGAAGSSQNYYFKDILNCMSIGMAHSDGYWVEDFPVTTMQNIIQAAARDAVMNHFHCSYGRKHIDDIADAINTIYSCDRNSPWRQFLKECYRYFGVSTKWD